MVSVTLKTCILETYMVKETKPDNFYNGSEEKVSDSANLCGQNKEVVLQMLTLNNERTKKQMFHSKNRIKTPRTTE